MKETTPEEYPQDSELASPELLTPSSLLSPTGLFSHPLSWCLNSSKIVLFQPGLGKLYGLSPHEVGWCRNAPGGTPEWRLWVSKQSGKPLA